MKSQFQRTGSAAILLLILLIPLLGLLAFSVDYGFLLFVRTDLQRVADQAAMAAVRDLVPDENGNQDEDAVRARVREYVALNFGEEFTVLDEDIEIGRYDPDTIYSSVDLLNNGTFDTVRVTLRRDSLADASVSLYFARLLGSDEADIRATATAVLQTGRYLEPGTETGVLPFAVDEDLWNGISHGAEFSIYGDGKVEDGNGNQIPGNFGTVDIGPTNNSTQSLGEQIENGLSQNDLDSLLSQGAIPTAEYIDANQSSLMLNGDTGFSAGMQSSVENVQGQFKLIPIYKPLGNVTGSQSARSKFMLAGHRHASASSTRINGFSRQTSKTTPDAFLLAGNGNGNGNGNGGGGNGGGNNFNYEIIGWGVVQVVTSTWNGSQNSSITVKRVSIYDGSLKPNTDLNQQGSGIEGMYTSPVLIQ